MLILLFGFATAALSFWVMIDAITDPFGSIADSRRRRNARRSELQRNAARRERARQARRARLYGGAR